MQQGGPSLPSLDAINPLLNPDKDTNFLSDLIPMATIRANITIELAKSLFDRLEKNESLFKSPKEVEWAIEILGYGFIPPHYQYVKDDRNHLKNILTIYEYLLCDEAELTNEGATTRMSNIQPVLFMGDYYHQKIVLKMLSHITLLFDKRNFDKKPNPLVGGIDPRIREEEMKVPIKLCAMAIRIYHKFLFRSYSYIYVDHWEYIIKLLLGLTMFLLQGPQDNKFPDRINVAITELTYNAWILSGLQNEEVWSIFTEKIHEMINKDITLASYWVDICTELTSKLLIDFKCYDPPKLIIAGEKDKVEYQENLLIISHNYNSARSNVQIKKKFTLFSQPFLFNISQEQVQYLWGKMITMMNKPNSISNPRIYSLIMKGIRNVVNLLLRLGAHFKPKEEFQDYSEYNIENKRTFRIEPQNSHEFRYFYHLLKHIIQKQNKIVPNEKRPPPGVNSTAKNYNDEEKNNLAKKVQNFQDSISPKITKRTAEEQAKTPLLEQEYSWIVKTEKIPSGESLLKLFGKLLFETAEISLAPFEEVRLTAICVLCQIFTKASGPFTEASVKRFYQVYLNYLDTDVSWSSFQTLLKNSTELFIVNHLTHNVILQKPLITKLVSYYAPLVKEKIESPLQQDKVLRRACNKLCSSLLCFFNDEYGLINEVYRYDKNVKDKIYELLENAFQRDRDSFMAQKNNPVKMQNEEIKILARSSWNFMVYSILNSKINQFAAKVNEIWFERTFPTMNNLAIEILLVLGEMCLMRLDECESPSQMTSDIFSAGINIIEKICRLIELRYRDLNEASRQAKSSDKEDLIKILSSAFGILHTWLLVVIHLKDLENTGNQTYFTRCFESTIKMLIGIQNNNNDPFSTAVKCMLAALFNRLGALSFNRNIPFTSSVLLNDDKINIKPLDEVTAKLEEKCLLTIAIGDDTLLSFYDFQIESTNDVLVFMIRNMVGKFVWYGELFYKLYSPETKEAEEMKEQQEKIKKVGQKEEEVKQRLMSLDLLTSPRSGGGGANQELEVLLQQQFEIEDQYEETYYKTNNEQAQNKANSETSFNHSDEPDETAKAVAKINTIKMFLLNTGLLSLKEINKLTHIPFNETDIDLLKKIDSFSARYQILASIIYVLKPSSEKLDEFPRFDTLFQKFIEELGIVIDESTLELGAHESIRSLVSQHKKVLFASNPLYELVFTLPNLTHSQVSLQEISTISPIMIIWNAKIFTPYESFYPYIINQLDLKGHKTVLIITPLNESYFSLNLLKKDSNFMLFPPLNDFICSNHMLINVVVQIVISINREYQFRQQQLYYHENVLGKLIDRKKHISSLIQYYQKKDSSWELLKAFFNVPRTSE